MFFIRKRKVKKLAKKDKLAGKVVQRRRDPGIPNSWPFKEELLKEAQEFKEEQRKEKEREKEIRKQERKSTEGKESSMNQDESLLEDNDATEENTNEEREPTLEDIGNVPLDDPAVTLNHIIANSDVLLEVLDAREAYATRCYAVEAAVAEEFSDITIVIVLTKIDLIPVEHLKDLVFEIKKHFPVILWKSTVMPVRRSKHDKNPTRYIRIQKQPTNSLIQQLHFGPEILMNMLGSMAKSRTVPLIVGVVGFPSTGRRSVVRTLTNSSSRFLADKASGNHRNRLCTVAENVMLFTMVGEVTCMERTHALDYPFKCCRPYDERFDHLSIAEDIVNAMDKKLLARLYNIPAFSDYQEFESLIQDKYRSNMEFKKYTVAKQVISDWCDNLIPHYQQVVTSKLITVPAKMTANWLKLTNFNEMLSDIMNYDKLRQFCSSGSQTYSIVPVVEAKEEEVDYTCFLTAEDKEDAGMDVESETDESEEDSNEDRELLE